MPKQRTLLVSTGQQFGRLTVLDPEIRIPSKQPSRPGGWRAALCRCDCGNQKTVRLNHLLSGLVVSCGCRIQKKTHGLWRHPMYGTWINIIHRCENSRSKDYPGWGGRGIRVCQQWRDVTAFTAWIDANLGLRPDGCTLDRIDNDGDYEPGNVKWSTPKQQSSHKRNPVRIIRGRTMVERIAVARDLADKGMVQREIAQILGVSGAAVSVYLHKRGGDVL